jgi:hypothetical protein
MTKTNPSAGIKYSITYKRLEKMILRSILKAEEDD